MTFGTIFFVRRKLPALLTSVFVGLFTLESAHAIAPFGDNSALFVTGVINAAYNDNLFLGHTDTKSTGVFDFMPGLAYDFGHNGSDLSGSLDGYVDFQVISAYTHLDHDLPNLVFTSAYDDSKTKINLDASYHELDLATFDITNTMVVRDVYHADFSGEEILTEKTSVGAGVYWDDTNYFKTGYANLESTALPVNVYYALEPKLDLSAGFRYRDNTVGGNGVNSTDQYYNVGARGEFSPLLTGEIDIGYNTQKMDVGASHNGLGADASLTYAYSDKTNVVFGLTDDFGYGADGRALRQVSGNIGANSAISDQWAVDGAFSYGRYSYYGLVPNGSGGVVDQQDNFYTFQAGVTYIVSLNAKIRAGYTFQRDNSNVSADTFNDNIINLAVSLSF